MKLKLPLIVGVLVLAAHLAPSCANQAQGFSIADFYPMAPGCDGISNGGKVFTTNGFLDVAAGQAQYFTGVHIIGAENIAQQEVVVGQTLLERANRNTPVIQQMVINYRLSKRLGGATPKPFITNFSAPFSANGEIFAPIQLISSELALQLFDGLAPSPGVAPSSVIEDFVDISVDVEFKGEFSASRTPFTTGILTFSLRAFRSNPSACPDGYAKFYREVTTTDGGTTLGPPELCQYAGQTNSQLVAPALPRCCLGAGSEPGC